MAVVYEAGVSVSLLGLAAQCWIQLNHMTLRGEDEPGAKTIHQIVLVKQLCVGGCVKLFIIMHVQVGNYKNA